MKKYILSLLIAFIFIGTSNGQKLHYPNTEKINQVDNYFGTQVTDPYRWLENDTAKNVADWVKSENKVTFDYLAKIPFRNKIKERLTKIWNYPKYYTPFRQGKNWFFYKNDGLQNQNVLYIEKSLDGPAEVFLDPNKLSTDGTVALGGTAFSNDGKYFAYAISKSGSDWREIFVMDVETKTKLKDDLMWAKFTGLSWKGNGFYYSRYLVPADTAKAYSTKNEYHKLYYHTIGDDQSKDMLVFEDNEHPLRLFGMTVTEDERFEILSAEEGGSKGNALYYRDTKSEDRKFHPIIETFDDNMNIVDNIGDKLLLTTNRKAPNGRVLLFDIHNPEEKNWVDVLPEQKDVLETVTTLGGKIVATYMRDVAHHVFVYRLDGEFENEVPIPTLGTVGGFDGKKDDTFTFFTLTSFAVPSTIYKYDIATNKTTLFKKSDFDFDADKYETKQVFYKSKDGTPIPMFIVHKKGMKLDGNNPTLLYGYGGFNITINPTFSVSRLIWLEQGGVYALANIRGGGEYGEKWHEAGMKLNKQNVFNDFIAAAEYLILEKYTSSKKLAIQGGSNGGLLIGAVTNQRPDLFRVALPAVGVMDMLRFHKFTIGWAWVPDYGSSDDSTQFKNLYSISPVHNIKEGVNYPAVLVTTADHDDRVVPAHSFKYISTLQEKYKGNNPVLIRIETKAGHGGGKPTAKIIEETSDLYAFTFFNMGIKPKY